MEPMPERLTKGPEVTQLAPSPRAVALNMALNFIGMAAPLLAAVVTIPALNRSLGTEKVGFLTLAWALIGYFSLFDLGIGRALTKLVAERLALSEVAAVTRLIWTALALMLSLGILAGGGMALSAEWLVRSALRIPPALQSEAILAVYVLAVTVPFVVTSAGLRGILEAQGRFLISNSVRAPLGVWLIASPLLLLPFGRHSLAWIAGALLLGRLAAWVAYFVACLRGMPALRANIVFHSSDLRPLLHFGGWMTVSNVISPLMVYMDRFLLGNRISLQAVAWYATPFEVVTKVLLVPTAVVTVLFPLFSSLATAGRDETSRLHTTSVRYLGFALFPITFAVALFSREALSIWVGPEFASHSYKVARLIAIGCFFNGLAAVPYALIQGRGRPDITAKLHFVEFPVYAALVFWLTSAGGIAGTALAWAIRMAIDFVALEAIARSRSTAPSHHDASASHFVLALALFGAAFVPLSMALKGTMLAAVLVAECFIIWRSGLSPRARAWIASCGSRGCRL